MMMYAEISEIVALRRGEAAIEYLESREAIA
jgi:hypothetical protein